MLNTLMTLVLLVPAAQGRSASSASIIVELPSDAAVYIDGVPTRSGGSRRWFQSPPLEVGWSYPYTIKVVWKGKEVERKLLIKPAETARLSVKASDFDGTGTTGGTATGATTLIPERVGFVLKEVEGRVWIFREGSKEAKEAIKHGPPEKHVTRLNVAPWKVTLKAPDTDTLEEYLLAKPGFVTRMEDGRLWVFKAGSKELAAFLKDGELAKQVVRPGAGPGGKTLKAPDNETLLGYVVAVEGFDTIVEDGRVWVFKAGSKDLADYKKHGELAKHVIRINAGPLGMTLKAPDAATLEAYQKTFVAEVKK